MQKERQEAAAVARAEQRAEQRQRSDAKTKMKGKNRPSRRQVPRAALHAPSTALAASLQHVCRTGIYLCASCNVASALLEPERRAASAFK